MPELPELQALAERLDARLTGSLLEGVEVLSFSSLKTFTPPPEDVVGKPLGSVSRRGKFLVLSLQSLRMLVHLSQGGRIVLEEDKRNARPRGGVVRFSFDGAPAVLVKEFGTERKAGWWVLDWNDQGPLAKLGPEPFSEEFASFVMRATDSRRVHTLLRDQGVVAGIGRGYADDILHAARLSPFQSLASLEHDERVRLLDAVHGVLEAALDMERRRSGGLPDKLGDRFAIHHRSGSPCPRCGSDLRLVSYESHEVTYCPTCQTGGKVLADRRLSRLVK